ncbi:MAG: hypothetical protein ABI639_12355 [Thermoanaerobaculia bacterium]
MKRMWLAALLSVAVVCAGAAPMFAVIGTIDNVPAATLLLPYFEVDLDNPAGVTTLMSINNASATAVLAHVVIWTDLSVHVLDFNIYLTGYDVQSINLRDVLVHGNLPLTADDARDPSDTISNQGPASQDISFPGCAGILPYANPALNALYLDHVQSTLTGQPSDLFFNGLCSGIDHGDRLARGYVTVDAVNQCSTNFPPDVGYFVSGGNGVATNQNVLWGDYIYVNSEQNFANGDTLVHIEADPTLGLANYTFYYRYTNFNGSPGADNREGLGNVFAVRYLDGGVFSGGSSLKVWRDSKRSINPFSCNANFPNPFPLGQSQIVVFDEEENFETPQGCQISPCLPQEGIIPFPWEAQNTEVGSADLPVGPSFGWIYLNLNSTVPGSQVNFEPLMQNWVAVEMRSEGRYSVGFGAIQLGNVTDGFIEDPCIGPGCFPSVD